MDYVVVDAAKCTHGDLAAHGTTEKQRRNAIPFLTPTVCVCLCVCVCVRARARVRACGLRACVRVIT